MIDLKKLRADKKWSQQEAADALGVTRPTWQRLESGSNLQTGEPIQIDRRTRLALSALIAGLEPV